MCHRGIWIDASAGEESIFLCGLAVFHGHPVFPRNSVQQHPSINAPAPTVSLRPGLACALNRNLAKRTTSFAETWHSVTEIAKMTVFISVN